MIVKSLVRVLVLGLLVLTAACSSNANNAAPKATINPGTPPPPPPPPAGAAARTASPVAAVTRSGGAGGVSSPVAVEPLKPAEKTKLKIAVGGQDQFIYLPATLALQLGYYKDEGLEVEIDNFSGGSKAEEALLGGSADVVTGFYDHTITLQAKQQKIETVALFDNFPGLVLLVGSKSADKIKSIADLKGKKVGVSALGSSTQYMLNYLLKRNNIPQDAVEVLAAGTGAPFRAALTGGNIDAGITVDPTATVILQAKEATVLADTRTTEGSQTTFGGTYPAGGFYLKNDFIAANPATVQHLINAGVRALQWIQTHSAEEIADKMPPEFYGGDKALYVASLKATLPLLSKDGILPADGPKTVQDVLAVSDDTVRNAKIDLSQTFTNDFAQKAQSYIKR